ncbi:MAG: diaminopimelate dehydrogenase, partial [Oscillospiraceae bacterium]|nr:diaminopimelate dehydrogenase [Oscillospiraceae bacterium]
MNKIRIGIVGYGNLGRGTELAIRQNPDTELACVFTRRDPSSLKILTENVPVYSLDDIRNHRDCADVLILCGGSASDLPVQGPQLAELFCTVDSFDTHAKIPQYFAAVDESAKKGGNVSIIEWGGWPVLYGVAGIYGGC